MKHVTDVDKPFGEADHYDFGNPACYEEREITLGETNTDARTTPGDFIQLDYEFQIYYPNTGDFYGNGALGIADASGIEGYEYASPMDTSEWTGIKGVTFDFDVILKLMFPP